MAQRKIPKKIEKEIRDYLEVLRAEHLPIQSAYLFGSYAKGTEHEWSDIDLCVISPKFQNPWQALQYLWSKRVKDSGLTIEPVGYHPDDFTNESPLAWEIKHTGIPISL